MPLFPANKRRRLAKDILPVLGALADPTRLELFYLLMQRPLPVLGVASRFRLSRPTISHHLAIMRRAGVLLAKKQGREIYYESNARLVLPLLGELLDSLEDG